MSKKGFRSQASSSGAVAGTFGGFSDGAVFAASASGFGGGSSSPLSHVYEPPGLKGLSDPNVVVAFKNLQKRDGTTKSKALEDLQNYTQSLGSHQDGLEAAMLEAWIKVYPRISIDSSRRVRQLAHTLQGQIAALCGKRIARYMPQIVGAWLAGMYDNDKSVSRAAQESFKLVFPSEEKYQHVWQVYQADVVQFSRNVIEKETAQTLSDERTTSPDDAMSKYTRTLGTAIMMITNLIEIVAEADLAKAQPQLHDMLFETQVWKFASFSDAFVRRAVYKLLVVSLVRRKSDLDPATISATVLTSALHSSQIGSAYDYAKALALLSAKMPSVWTQDYHGTGKKSARNRLCYFLRKGSQGGPPETWSYIEDLINCLSVDVLACGQGEETTELPSNERPSYTEVLEALHDGIANKDEPRANSGTAWKAYLTTSNITTRSLQSPHQRAQLIASSILPILPQYIRPSPENSRWAIAGSQQQAICRKACLQVLRLDEPLFIKHWRALSNQIIEDVKVSLPEQSKDYVKSQESLGAEATRWYGLQAALFDETDSSTWHDALVDSLDLELAAAISTLKLRNGKPYGAATLVDSVIRLLPKPILKIDAIHNRLNMFANDDIPGLLFSPSAKFLIHIMGLLQETCDVGQGFDKCTNALIKAPESAEKRSALRSLLSSPSIASNESLASMARQTLQLALRKEETNDWDVVMAAASNAYAPKELTDDILATMTQSLSIHAQRLPSLHGFELLEKQNINLLREYSTTPKGYPLAMRLLYLADGPDDTVSQRAQGLSRVLQNVMLAGPNGTQPSGSFINLIKHSFNEVNVESLSIEMLLKPAEQAFVQSSEHDKPTLAAALLPSPSQWSKALEPFLSKSPNPSIAITTVFGGAIALIKTAHETWFDVSRDAQGQSLLLRMARYVVDLISATNAFNVSSLEQQLNLAKSIAITLQLAGNNLSVQGSMPLWASSEKDTGLDLVDFVAKAQSLLVSWLRTKPKSVLIDNVMSQLLETSVGLSSSAYYSASAFSAIATELNDLHGPSGDEVISRLKSVLKSPDTFTAAALLTSASGGQGWLRTCNELLADLTVLTFDTEQKCLRSLVLLNCVLEGSDSLIDDVPKQRLVFFVKHMVEELPKASSTDQAEVMRALHVVLPPIKEIYGSFWGTLFEIMGSVFRGSVTDENLPLLLSSLRLLSLFRKPFMQDGNDDLLDAWTDHKSSFAKDLISLMNKLKDLADWSHQPRRIVNEILSRQIAGLGTDITEDEEELYPVLASESEALQRAAYKILHETVPVKQEQLALEKALEKGYEAKLPEELLSLILAPPPIGHLTEADFSRNIPSSLRSYLLSWRLTFDHWTNASYALQADYTKNLAEGAYLPDLLNLTFYLLITSRHKPVDASKFSIETYEPDVESPEKDTQRLVIHLYYLTLLHVPSLAKNWWRDSTSRQTNLAVQNWTEKYISPFIIATELSAIKSWAPNQAATDDSSLTVKVSHTTREISASIPVDEQTTSISIRLPPSYPLSRAEVTGIHRVGVPENKWNSWIRNAQGQVTTSEGGSNALMDCILAWKRNVTAAMKGQTECAICYSVVGGDKTLPKKKCPTGRHTYSDMMSVTVQELLPFWVLIPVVQKQQQQ
ncbi:MAG: hypothetical protein Q9217_005035 [Psora testacea]